MFMNLNELKKIFEYELIFMNLIKVQIIGKKNRFIYIKIS